MYERTGIETTLKEMLNIIDPQDLELKYFFAYHRFKDQMSHKEMMEVAKKELMETKNFNVCAPLHNLIMASIPKWEEEMFNKTKKEVKAIRRFDECDFCKFSKP